MTDPLALRGFVDALARAGVADAVVCPGSRSTPLALALRQHPAIRVRVLLDERSAGFFALGMAKTARRPVAVLTTSGTAAANLLPAVVEASLGRVPLVILTADRPPELRDRGAAQAIDQARLFGTHAKWFADLPLLDGADVTRRHVAGLAARAVATARTGPAGPVHLNVPFREPLIPDTALGPLPEAPATAVVAGPRVLPVADLDALARRIAGRGRGLIVAGPQDDPALAPALARLAAALGWPIAADALSLVRSGRHDRSLVLARADHLLRPGAWRDAHLPDVVLRFGAMPTSKPVLALLEEHRPDLVVVDGDGGWREPAVVPATMIHADPVATAESLAEALGRGAPRTAGRLRPAVERKNPWLDEWLAADRAVDRALGGWLAERTAAGEAFEGAPFAILGELLSDGAVLWASSSMPVRDLDAWLPGGSRAIRALANRGANGIDGVLSSALGAAATGSTVALVIGDVALLHDLGGLVSGRLAGLDATIVVVANDGGGIFSFLPQATASVPGAGLPDHFEELFGTPHGIDIGPVVTALGATFRRAGADDLRDALVAALAAPGLQVVELASDRARNLELHREAAAVAQRALAEQLAAGRPATGEAPTPPDRGR